MVRPSTTGVAKTFGSASRAGDGGKPTATQVGLENDYFACLYINILFIIAKNIIY